VDLRCYEKRRHGKDQKQRRSTLVALIVTLRSATKKNREFLAILSFITAVINSELQYIGVQVAEFVGEKTNVGFWIGKIKALGKKLHASCKLKVCDICERFAIQRAQEIMSGMRQSELEYLHKPPLYRPKPIANKAAYFLSLTKKHVGEN
jgi:hypothetical protein